MKDHEEKRIMNDVESGDIDAVEDTNSTTMDTSFCQILLYITIQSSEISFNVFGQV